MGLPVIEVSFKTLAETIVKRSTRGVVAVLLEDSTDTASMATYKTVAEIDDTAWTAANVKVLQTVLESGASKVLAVRVVGGETPDYSDTLDLIKGMEWNWVCAPDAASSDVTALVAWIAAARTAGHPYKAVVGGATTPDNMGVVNLMTTNIKSVYFGESTPITYTPQKYTPRVAGVLAGMALNRSVTGYVFEDIVQCDASAAPDTDIDAGKFIIVFNGTGYEAARGVTSLVTTSDAKPAQFKKIKHVEGADLMASDLALLFKAGFKGLKVNSYSNKQSLVAVYIAYLGELVGTVLSPDYTHTAAVDFDAQKAYLREKEVDVDNMDDMQILKANTDEKVFVRLNVQFIDAMEDVYISVVLN
jgi:hypothetical protein